MSNGKRLRVLVLLAAGGLTVGVGGVGGVNSPRADERPPDVPSMRHEILDQETYEGLAEQWGAYVADHTDDPRAWVEWGDAIRYAGQHFVALRKYERAFEIDSSNAAAIEAHTSQDIHSGKDGKFRLAYRRLRRALESDPEYPNTLYSLALASLRAQDTELHRRCLQTMISSGDLPRPIVDFGRNIVAGAPEGAIIFTNGDNDTYPCWAFQVLAGERPDIDIVNLSLLNTTWYIRLLRDRGLPITLSDAEIKDLKHTHERKVSDQLQAHIFHNLKQRGWPRPLYYAVTVYQGNKVLPCKTVLEGLIERIVPTEKPLQGAQEQNWERIRELVDTVYALGSATDAYLNWEHESAVAKLMTNYAAILHRLGGWLLENDRAAEADPYLYDAVRIATFHGYDDWAESIMRVWEGVAGESRLYPRAKQLRED